MGEVFQPSDFRNPEVWAQITQAWLSVVGEKHFLVDEVDLIDEFSAKDGNIEPIIRLTCQALIPDQQVDQASLKALVARQTAFSPTLYQTLLENLPEVVERDTGNANRNHRPL